jgi:(p)ppGpp synthase/HD superfamily hydrolase
MEDYLKPCQYSIRLLEKLNALDPASDLDFELIDKAIYWARQYHNGQFRKSGEPFYSHPLEVAYIISDHLPQTNTIVASILHDIVEDTDVTIGMILDEFGWRIAEMVDMLTRDRPNGTKFSVEQILYNAHAKGDKEVLLIKCIDRLHNIQTLKVQSQEKINKTVKETLVNFTVLSEYLELPFMSKTISHICKKNQKELTIEERLLAQYKFSFNDNYQPLSLIFQNN